MTAPILGWHHESQVDGMRAVKYWGKIHVSVFVPGGPDSAAWEAGYQRVGDDMCKRAMELSEGKATDVVSVDEKADPFAEVDGVAGLHFEAEGTVAQLEPLYLPLVHITGNANYWQCGRPVFAHERGAELPQATCRACILAAQRLAEARGWDSVGDL